MTEPRADAARRYLATIGVRTTPRTRTRPAIEDDDYDVEIGPARVEPDIDVQTGPASMIPDDETIESEPHETVLPEIRIVGDARRESPRIGSMLSALPESLSEPLGRAIDDDSSALGEYLRTMADIGDRTGVPDLFDNETLEWLEAGGNAMRRVGDRLGAGPTASYGDRDIAAPLGDMDTTDRRGLGVLDESPAQRERRRASRLRDENRGGDIVGGIVATAPLAALSPASTARTVMGRVAQSALANAGAGALSGYALSDDDEMIGGDDGEIIGGRLGDAIEGAAMGGVLGGGFQLAGEGIGAGARWLRQMRQAASNPGPVLEPLGDAAAASAELSDGPQAADAIRRLTRSASPDAPPVEMPEGARAGQFDDDVTIGPLRTTDNPAPSSRGRFDDIPGRPDDEPVFGPRRATWEEQLAAEDPDDLARALREDAVRRQRAGGYNGEEPEADIQARLGERARAEARAARAADEGGGTAPRPARRMGARQQAAEQAADPADVTMIEDPAPLPDDVDEMLGPVTERPRRAPPVMPQSGPELRAAAMRGERSFGARGERGADPSIAATDELSAMARDYADIESGSGGFQPLKLARIREAMSADPPPSGWERRSQDAIDAMRSRLDQVTRHAGANSRLVGPAGEARFALDEAERMLQARAEMGAPVDPSEVWAQLNRANMSVGRAAAREAQSTGSGMQHTSAFAEPLTLSYQQMRSYLADPAAWGTAAARVQREMNATTAPLLRTGRALRERSGALFADSGEQAANGGGFRTYETARPEAVRSLMSRAGDDAYEGERALLRAWVENYGDQGATLADLSRDPALAARAREMQARAGRLLDILDRAEVEGRAAQMLASVADMRPGSERLPSVGQMVRMVARIESGELRAPEMSAAMRALEALENASAGRAAVPVGAAIREMRDEEAPQSAEPIPALEPLPTPRYQRDLEADMPDAGATAQYDDEPRWMRQLR